MAYNPKDKNPSGVVLFGNNGSDQVFESVTDFVYDTGNTRLGISTSSPQYTLDVSGTGAFHTIRFADGTEMTTSGGGGGGGTTYTAGSGLTLDGTEFNVFGGSGNFQYIELKSSTQDPQIYFLGSGSNDTPITLNILSSYQSANSSGSALVFDGTEGQLFAITDNLSSGVIFSVADIAGLPLIEADASGDVQLIEFGRYVGVGTGTPEYQLDVFGTGRFSSGIIFPDGNIQTGAYTGDAGGGGGSPGGSVNQIQINDGAGGFTAASSSDQFTFSNNVIELGRSSTSNSGSDVRNTWFGNNFCIGGQNFSSSTDSDADFNTAVGINALGAMTFPVANTAVGYYSMYQNTLGNHNTAVGYLSLQGLAGIGAGVAGDYNVAIGSSACAALQGASTNTASYNTAVGYQSQNSNQVHNNVTTLGYRAGYNVQSYNIYIGDDCPYGTTAANGSGNLIIRSVGGYGNLSAFRGEGDNELCIGNIYAGNQATQRAGIGDVNTIGDSPDAALHIQPKNSSDLVLKVQGVAAQSANLQGWENSSNVTLAHVDATGGISGTSYTFADGTIQTTAAGGGGGGGTPGGSNTQIQFNDGGSFGGSPAFTFNGSTVTLTGTGLLFDVRNVSADTLFSIEDTDESSIIASAQAGQTGYILDIRDRFDTNIAHIDPSGKLHYQSSFSPISNEGTASSFTFNLDESNIFSGTLSAASTLTTSNGDVGQRFLVRLRQGSGGSKTVSSWFGGRVSWPGGSAPTLSSTAGHVDLFGFLVTHGTAPTLYYDGFTIATGIQ